MSDQQNSKIAEFVEIAQASPDEARELLEASNWDLETALGLYYRGKEDEDNEEVEHEEPHREVVDRPPPQNIPTSSFGTSSSSSSSSVPKISKANKSKEASRRFATLSDLTSGGGGDFGDSPMGSGSEDDGPENLFTGGEKSGLAVQNPDGNGARLINEIFRQAQQNQTRRFGDEEEEDDEGVSGPRNQTSPYRGTGFTLGGDDVPSQRVDDSTQAPQTPATTTTENAPERVIRHLTFWRNGFSVEDGPLYSYDDPANVQHLQAINSGRAPLSLLNVQNDQRVDVHITKKLDQVYEPPKRKLGGFSGQGNRLGSPIPGQFPTTQAAPPTTITTRPSSSTAAAATSQPSGSGDATVMLRLGDGRSIKHKFDSSGSVRQLYDFVDSQTSEGRSYVLQTTFPNRELNDKNATLKESGIVGAVVVQKWS